MYNGRHGTISQLEDEIARLQKELESRRSGQAKEVVTRVEEIRQEITNLLEEATRITREVNMPFYRDNFIQGIADGTAGCFWDADYYWQASDINY